MLKTVQISGYRSFQRVAVDGLTRVNLFVGKNNCGKTSVLEAIQIIASKGDPSSVFQSLQRRGEAFPNDEVDRPSEELDISHLFYGHKGELGSGFEISGNNGQPISCSCRIVEARESKNSRQRMFFAPEEEGPFALELKTGVGEPFILPLSASRGFPYDARRRMAFVDRPSDRTISFVPPEGLEGRNLGSLWDSVALTTEEPNVIEALRIIEPSIERIAFLGRERSRWQAGFFVKLKDTEERLPIGSLGDGMKRLLVLSLSVSRASSGYLFVDEIDTGLHYSVMEDMWKLIITTARRLDVQVFATSHSQDCLASLARLRKTSPEFAGEASVHRLEKGKSKTVRYDAEELLTATTQDIEIR